MFPTYCFVLNKYSSNFGKKEYNLLFLIISSRDASSTGEKINIITAKQIIKQHFTSEERVTVVKKRLGVQSHTFIKLTAYI